MATKEELLELTDGIVITRGRIKASVFNPFLKTLINELYNVEVDSSNWANTNLSLTSDRLHNAQGYSIIVSNIDSFTSIANAHIFKHHTGNYNYLKLTSPAAYGGNYIQFGRNNVDNNCGQIFSSDVSISMQYNSGNLIASIFANGFRVGGNGSTSPNARFEVISPSASSLDLAFSVRNNTDTTNHFHVTGDGQWAFGNVSVAYGYFGSIRVNTDIDSNGIFLDSNGSTQGSTYMSNQSTFNTHYSAENFLVQGFRASLLFSPDGTYGYKASVGRNGGSGALNSIGYYAQIQDFSESSITGGKGFMSDAYNADSVAFFGNCRDGAVTPDLGYAGKFNGRTLFRGYSKSSLPSPTNQSSHNGFIIVTDAVGSSSHTICISDGSNWIDINTGVAVV